MDQSLGKCLCRQVNLVNAGNLVIRINTLYGKTRLNTEKLNPYNAQY